MRHLDLGGPSDDFRESHPQGQLTGRNTWKIRPLEKEKHQPKPTQFVGTSSHEFFSPVIPTQKCPWRITCFLPQHGGPKTIPPMKFVVGREQTAFSCFFQVKSVPCMVKCPRNYSKWWKTVVTLDSQSAWAPAKSLPSQSQEPHEGQLDESSGASVVRVEPALLVIQMLLFVRCPRLPHQVMISFYLSEDLMIRTFCHNFMIHTAHPHHPLKF